MYKNKIEKFVMSEGQKEYIKDCKENLNTFISILRLGNPKDLVFRELYYNSLYLNAVKTKKIKPIFEDRH